MSDRYAVFGNPIAHSKSPQIHRLFAQQTAQDLIYTKQCIDPGHFTQAVTQFFAAGGKGLNITVPFKQQAFALASRHSERAAAAAAANTLWLDHDGQLLADNTDGLGLVHDIHHQLAWTIRGARVLLIGAGGAARGVLLPLLQQRPAQLVVTNRNLDKAQHLCRELQASLEPGETQVSAQAMDALDGAFDLVINATSASLSQKVPPVSASIFAPGSSAYDMVYGAEPTVFMAFARAHQARIADGLGMLVAQAAESFYLWRGLRPDIAPVIRQLRQELAGD